MELEIRQYEERLRIAMMNSDIEVLDKLISDDLVFINHSGQLISKDNDLDFHKNEIARLRNINIINQNVYAAENIAIVISDVNLEVVDNNQTSIESLIYTRVWQKTNDEWMIIRGQATKKV